MATIPEGFPFAVEDVEAELGDARDVAELLAAYGEYLTGQLESLRVAATFRRLQEVHRIAHAIRSGALTIGAADLAGAAGNLEEVSLTSFSPLTPALIVSIEERTRELRQAAHEIGSGC